MQGFIRSDINDGIYFGDEAVNSLIVPVEELWLDFKMILFDPVVHFLFKGGLAFMNIFVFLS
jgi:hypothetical protein